jgi:hypothetical protein
MLILRTDVGIWNCQKAAVSFGAVVAETGIIKEYASNPYYSSIGIGATVLCKKICAIKLRVALGFGSRIGLESELLHQSCKFRSFGIFLKIWLSARVSGVP